MTAFDLVDDAGPHYDAPDYDGCRCGGQGPWNVTVTISGIPEEGVSVGFTHVDCGRSMDWLDTEDVNGDDLPLRLSVVSPPGRGPDDVTWFEMELREPTEGGGPA